MMKALKCATVVVAFLLMSAALWAQNPLSETAAYTQAEGSQPAGDEQQPPKTETKEGDKTEPADKAEEEAPAEKKEEAKPEDPKVQELQKKVVESWSKVKALSADFTINVNAEMAGRKMTVDGGGTIKVLKKGEEELSRFQMTNEMTQGEGDNVMKMEAKVLIINEGGVAYTLAEQFGQQMAMKTDPEDSQAPPMGGKDIFERLRQVGELKVLPDAKVDDNEVYVVEATPAEVGGPMNLKSVVASIDQKLGALRKLVYFTDTGDQVQTMTFQNFNTDPQFDPDMFKFEAPEGVVVQDRTGM